MSGSFAIIFWEDKILLFHRDNIPTIPYPDYWQLPGGGIEKRETPLQALKRELTEEVSFVPQTIHFLGKIKTNNGQVHLYLSFVDEYESKQFKHGKEEGQEIGFFTSEEALKLKLPPELRKGFIKNKISLNEAMKNKTVPKNIFL